MKMTQGGSLIAVVGVLVLGLGAMSAHAEDGISRERDDDTPAENAAKDALEGKAPPPIKDAASWMNTENGEPLSWSGLKGKVVLIDFWGTWCPPCRKAIPHLKKLAAKHAAEGLVVLGIHTKTNEEEGPSFVRKKNIAYPIAFDGNDEVIDRFHVDSFPDFYLIDHQGVLRFADIENSEVDRAVELLLSERNADE